MSGISNLEEARMAVALALAAFYKHVQPYMFPNHPTLDSLPDHEKEMLERAMGEAIAKYINYDAALLRDKEMLAQAEEFSRNSDDIEIGGDLLREAELLLGKQNFYGSES